MLIPYSDSSASGLIISWSCRVGSVFCLWSARRGRSEIWRVGPGHKNGQVDISAGFVVWLYSWSAIHCEWCSFLVSCGSDVTNVWLFRQQSSYCKMFNHMITTSKIIQYSLMIEYWIVENDNKCYWCIISSREMLITKLQTLNTGTAKLSFRR